MHVYIYLCMCIDINAERERKENAHMYPGTTHYSKPDHDFPTSKWHD